MIDFCFVNFVSFAAKTKSNINNWIMFLLLGLGPYNGFPNYGVWTFVYRPPQL